MNIPPLHVCHSLAHENEKLQSKYRKLTFKYKQLQKDFNELKAQQEKKDKHICEDSVSSKNIEAQIHKEVAEKINENGSFKKLLILHNEMKIQLEKRNKDNHSLNKKLEKEKAENEKFRDKFIHLNKEKESIKKQLELKTLQLSLFSSKSKDKSSTEDQLKKIFILKKELRKLQAENVCLKEELMGLDLGFFEEAEDMKYALQQSTKLNTQYEIVMKHLCKQFGLNYENTLNDNLQQ